MAPSMRLDGTDRHEVGPGFGASWSPAVSPDGLTVSAAGWNLLEGADQYEGIFTMSLDGSNPRWVTPFWNPFPHHAWSPDGDWIAVSDNLEDRAKPANLVLVRPDGSSASDPLFLTNYTRADQRAAVGSYSPDGQWILFRLREGDLWSLYVIRPDGSDMEQLTVPSSLAPLDIDWGPAPG